jgi:hypothetical protein
MIELKRFTMGLMLEWKKAEAFETPKSLQGEGLMSSYLIHLRVLISCLDTEGEELL